MHPDWMDWIVRILAGMIAARGLKILDGLKTSVDHLNEKMATVVERTLHHGKEIDKLDRRMTHVEKKI